MSGKQRRKALGEFVFVIDPLRSHPALLAYPRDHPNNRHIFNPQQLNQTGDDAVTIKTAANIEDGDLYGSVSDDEPVIEVQFNSGWLTGKFRFVRLSSIQFQDQDDDDDDEEAQQGEGGGKGNSGGRRRRSSRRSSTISSPTTTTTTTTTKANNKRRRSSSAAAAATTTTTTKAAHNRRRSSSSTAAAVTATIAHQKNATTTTTTTELKSTNKETKKTPGKKKTPQTDSTKSNNTVKSQGNKEDEAAVAATTSTRTSLKVASEAVSKKPMVEKGKAPSAPRVVSNEDSTVPLVGFPGSVPDPNAPSVKRKRGRPIKKTLMESQIAAQRDTAGTGATTTAETPKKRGRLSKKTLMESQIAAQRAGAETGATATTTTETPKKHSGGKKHSGEKKKPPPKVKTDSGNRNKASLKNSVTEVEDTNPTAAKKKNLAAPAEKKPSPKKKTAYGGKQQPETDSKAASTTPNKNKKTPPKKSTKETSTAIPKTTAAEAATSSPATLVEKKERRNTTGGPPGCMVECLEASPEAAAFLAANDKDDNNGTKGGVIPGKFHGCENYVGITSSQSRGRASGSSTLAVVAGDSTKRQKRLSPGEGSTCPKKKKNLSNFPGCKVDCLEAPSAAGGVSLLSVENATTTNTTTIAAENTENRAVGQPSKIKRKIVAVPPGKLGITLTKRQGEGAIISQIKPKGVVFQHVIELNVGDQLVAVDSVDVTNMPIKEIVPLLASNITKEERTLTVNTNKWGEQEEQGEKEQEREVKLAGLPKKKEERDDGEFLKQLELEEQRMPKDDEQEQKRELQQELEQQQQQQQQCSSKEGETGTERQQQQKHHHQQQPGDLSLLLLNEIEDESEAQHQPERQQLPPQPVQEEEMNEERQQHERHEKDILSSIDEDLNIADAVTGVVIGNQQNLQHHQQQQRTQQQQPLKPTQNRSDTTLTLDQQQQKADNHDYAPTTAATKQQQSISQTVEEELGKHKESEEQRKMEEMERQKRQQEELQRQNEFQMQEKQKQKELDEEQERKHNFAEQYRRDGADEEDKRQGEEKQAPEQLQKQQELSKEESPTLPLPISKATVTATNTKSIGDSTVTISNLQHRSHEEEDIYVDEDQPSPNTESTVTNQEFGTKDAVVDEEQQEKEQERRKEEKALEDERQRIENDDEFHDHHQSMEVGSPKLPLPEASNATTLRKTIAKMPAPPTPAQSTQSIQSPTPQSPQTTAGTKSPTMEIGTPSSVENKNPPKFAAVEEDVCQPSKREEDDISRQKEEEIQIQRERDEHMRLEKEEKTRRLAGEKKVVEHIGRPEQDEKQKPAETLTGTETEDMPTTIAVFANEGDAGDRKAEITTTQIQQNVSEVTEEAGRISRDEKHEKPKTTIRTCAETDEPSKKEPVVEEQTRVDSQEDITSKDDSAVAMECEQVGQSSVTDKQPEDIPSMKDSMCTSGEVVDPLKADLYNEERPTDCLKEDGTSQKVDTSESKEEFTISPTQQSLAENDEDSQKVDASETKEELFTTPNQQSLVDNEDAEFIAQAEKQEISNPVQMSTSSGSEKPSDLFIEEVVAAVEKQNDTSPTEKEPTTDTKNQQWGEEEEITERIRNLKLEETPKDVEKREATHAKPDKALATEPFIEEQEAAVNGQEVDTIEEITTTTTQTMQAQPLSVKVDEKETSKGAEEEETAYAKNDVPSATEPDEQSTTAPFIEEKENTSKEEFTASTTPNQQAEPLCDTVDERETPVAAEQKEASHAEPDEPSKAEPFIDEEDDTRKEVESTDTQNQIVQWLSATVEETGSNRSFNETTPAQAKPDEPLIDEAFIQGRAAVEDDKADTSQEESITSAENEQAKPLSVMVEETRNEGFEKEAPAFAKPNGPSITEPSTEDRTRLTDDREVTLHEESVASKDSQQADFSVTVEETGNMEEVPAFANANEPSTNEAFVEDQTAFEDEKEVKPREKSASSTEIVPMPMEERTPDDFFDAKPQAKDEASKDYIRVGIPSESEMSTKVDDSKTNHRQEAKEGAVESEELQQRQPQQQQKRREEEEEGQPGKEQELHKQNQEEETESEGDEKDDKDGTTGTALCSIENDNDASAVDNAKTVAIENDFCSIENDNDASAVDNAKTAAIENDRHGEEANGEEGEKEADIEAAALPPISRDTGDDDAGISVENDKTTIEEDRREDETKDEEGEKEADANAAAQPLISRDTGDDGGGISAENDKTTIEENRREDETNGKEGEAYEGTETAAQPPIVIDTGGVNPVAIGNEEPPVEEHNLEEAEKGEGTENAAQPPITSDTNDGNPAAAIGNEEPPVEEHRVEDAEKDEGTENSAQPPITSDTDDENPAAATGNEEPPVEMDRVEGAEKDEGTEIAAQPPITSDTDDDDAAAAENEEASIDEQLRGRANEENEGTKSAALLPASAVETDDDAAATANEEASIEEERRLEETKAKDAEKVKGTESVAPLPASAVDTSPATESEEALIEEEQRQEETKAKEAGKFKDTESAAPLSASAVVTGDAFPENVGPLSKEQHEEIAEENEGTESAAQPPIEHDTNNDAAAALPFDNLEIPNEETKNQQHQKEDEENIEETKNQQHPEEDEENGEGMQDDQKKESTTPASAAAPAGSVSSVGVPTSNTPSPDQKTNKWGARFIVGRKSNRFAVLMVPPGKLGVSLTNRDDGKGTVVSKILQNGAFRRGMLCIGDRLVEIDGINVTKMPVSEIESLVASRADRFRRLTLDPVSAEEARAGEEAQQHQHQKEDKEYRSQDEELQKQQQRRKVKEQEKQQSQKEDHPPEEDNKHLQPQQQRRKREEEVKEDKEKESQAQRENLPQEEGEHLQPPQQRRKKEEQGKEDKEKESQAQQEEPRQQEDDKSKQNEVEETRKKPSVSSKKNPALGEFVWVLDGGTELPARLVSPKNDQSPTDHDGESSSDESEEKIEIQWTLTGKFERVPLANVRQVEGRQKRSSRTTINRYARGVDDLDAALRKRKSASNSTNISTSMSEKSSPKKARTTPTMKTEAAAASDSSAQNSKTFKLGRPRKTSALGADTIESKSQEYTRDRIEQMPVEKLCLETGEILETYPTVVEAQKSATNNPQTWGFIYVLQGRTYGSAAPNVYKGYFWRFKGSHRTPDLPSSSESSSVASQISPLQLNQPEESKTLEMGLEASSSNSFADNPADSGSEESSDTEDSGDGNPRLGCICGIVHASSRRSVFWLQCDSCCSWYKLSSNCIGIDRAQADKLEHWDCWNCPSTSNANEPKESANTLSRSMISSTTDQAPGEASAETAGGEKRRFDSDTIPSKNQNQETPIAEASPTAKRRKLNKSSDESPSGSFENESKATGEVKSHKAKDTIENKSLGYSYDVLEQMPVEKLCLESGRVLETFETVAEARRSVSNAQNLFLFRYCIQGRKMCQTSTPHVYKGYFWRFKGSDRIPTGISSSRLKSRSETNEVEENDPSIQKKPPVKAEADTLNDNDDNFDQNATNDIARRGEEDTTGDSFDGNSEKAKGPTRRSPRKFPAIDPSKIPSLVSKVARNSISKLMGPIDNALFSLGWTVEKRSRKKHYLTPGEQYETRTSRLSTVSSVIEFLLTSNDWKDNETIMSVIRDFVAAAEKAAEVGFVIQNPPTQKISTTVVVPDEALDDKAKKRKRGRPRKDKTPGGSKDAIQDADNASAAPSSSTQPSMTAKREILMIQEPGFDKGSKVVHGSNDTAVRKLKKPPPSDSRAQKKNSTGQYEKEVQGETEEETRKKYFTRKLIKVVVPPGRLGLKLSEKLVVRQILPHCELSDKIFLGDKLVEINNRNVETMLVRDFERFLADIANTQRIWVFSRPRPEAADKVQQEGEASPISMYQQESYTLIRRKKPAAKSLIRRIRRDKKVGGQKLLAAALTKRVSTNYKSARRSSSRRYA